MEEHLLLAVAAVAMLGLLAQWLAWRTKIPAIILLILAGLLAGPLLGIVRPSLYFGELLSPLIKLGVAVILFEGGLLLHFQELTHIAAGVRRLVTIGLVLTLVLGAMAARYLAHFSWEVAWVFGAIIVVTGPTVIVPLLRQAGLDRKPASYLKWEGIINDPLGALLAVVLFEYFIQGAGMPFHEMLSRLGIGTLTAAGLGVSSGYLVGVLFRRGAVPEYLKGPGILAVAITIFVIADQVLKESGLLATTVLGITIGNLEVPGIREIRRFKEGIAILLVSALFLVLTADLDPAILLKLEWRAFLLLLAVLLLVRPLSVLLSTIGAGMQWRERLLLAWIAPRGIVAAAVAGVFGPQLQEKGYAGAELLLPLIFALILLTVTLHGLSLGWLARKLGMCASRRNGVLIVGASPWVNGLAKTIQETGIPVMIADSSWHRLRTPRLAGIPVYYGEVLEEFAERPLEFNEMGYLFAATDNDAYNSLVCAHFANELGRTRVHQLPPVQEGTKGTKKLPRTICGVVAPAEQASYEDLLAKWYHNWTFQKSRLTSIFPHAEWQVTACPKGCLAFLNLLPNGTIQFNSPEQPLAPKPRSVTIWFGPKPQKMENQTRDNPG